MARTLAAHRRGELGAIPLYRMLERPLDSLRRAARKIARSLAANGVPAKAVPSEATVGGGSSPTDTVPSFAVELPEDVGVAERLRHQTPPVIVRILEGRILVDLKAVLPEHERALASALHAAYAASQDSQSRGT
jgi:L-seryl-tRNA(Ser) seleniumtransferase